MCKLSVSSLRKGGFTAFEAEVLNYVVTNNIVVGTSFKGIPNHPRYESSEQEFNVIENVADSLEVEWVTKGKVLSINPSQYINISNRNNNNSDTTATSSEPTTTATTSNNAALDAFTAFMANSKTEGYNQAKSEFEPIINNLKAKLAAANEGGKGTNITITIDGKTTKTNTPKILDNQFGDILELVANHENVYLYGPAGSGKNVLCEELAKALNVPFYYQNTILTKFDISGYKNAGGEFEETEFYKAWTNGGLFMLDEVDNSQAEALIALNAALANGYYTFPNIGKVKAHKDFYCIAAGNTNGQGATDEYCGRYKMDESSRDRFFFVKIDYNKDIEKSIVGEHKDILSFVYDLRKIVNELQLSLICGYRAISKLEKYYNKENIKFILDGFIFRGMLIDDIKEIAARLTDNNKYAHCIKTEY